MKAICTFTTVVLSGMAVPIMATMNSQTSIPIAPYIKSARLPNRSTVQKDNGVEQTLTRVVIREMRKGLLIVPKFVYCVSPIGNIIEILGTHEKDGSEVEDEVDTWER
jgi:hypothetical protein